MGYCYTTWQSNKIDGSNDLIRMVKKFEVRKEGKESQSVRPLEFDEFINILDIVRSGEVGNANLLIYRLLSIFKLQWHVIGRIDDMMKLKLDTITPNPEFPFALSIQMRWSKNILEERDSPVQILLGSMNDELCVLLSLGIYIEVMAMKTDQMEFLFGNGVDGDRSVRGYLNKVIRTY